MLLSLLALLFAFAVLAEMTLLVFYPDCLLKWCKVIFAWVEENYLLSQILSIGTVVLSGMIIASVTSFETLVASGWFWVCFCLAILQPIYAQKTISKIVDTIITDTKVQQHLNMYLVISVALALATILYLINPMWLFV